MIQSPKKRFDTRLNYESSVKVEDLESGIALKARMANYSKNGMCFKANEILRLSTKINIEIENSPYASPSFGSYERRHAKIIWRKKLETGLFKYGYGVRYIFAGDEETSQSDDLKKWKDLRKHPRKSLSIPILFAAQKRFFKGLTQNISPSGVFIKSSHRLKAGQALSLTIPLKGGQNAMIKGSVVWTNHAGFGAKFLNINKKLSTAKIQ